MSHMHPSTILSSMPLLSASLPKGHTELHWHWCKLSNINTISRDNGLTFFIYNEWSLWLVRDGLHILILKNKCWRWSENVATPHLKKNKRCTWFMGCIFGTELDRQCGGGEGHGRMLCCRASEPIPAKNLWSLWWKVGLVGGACRLSNTSIQIMQQMQMNVPMFQLKVQRDDIRASVKTQTTQTDVDNLMEIWHWCSVDIWVTLFMYVMIYSPSVSIAPLSHFV